MKSFRVRRPWMLAMCSGAALALGIVTGHGGAALAGPVPPAGIETWGQEHGGAFSHATPASLAYPEEYSDAYGDYSYDPVTPEGKYGYREMLDACDWESATDQDDRIGQLGYAGNFSHERDWENAPYEFGDGTTADVNEVARRSARDGQAEEAETSLAYEFGYGLEAQYEESPRENDFAYPEEYFYKYGYHHYSYADSEGKYGASEAFEGEEDRIGQIGNAANFSHERDWENAPYEFGDGTTADLREVAVATAFPAVDAWDADISAPYEHGYDADAEYADGYTMDSMDAEYGDGYTGATSGEDEDQAVESSSDLSADAWISDDSYGEEAFGNEYHAGEMNADAMDAADGENAGKETDQGTAGKADEKATQPVNDAGLDEARYDYPTESAYGYYDPRDYDSASDESYRSDCSDEGLACDSAAEAGDEASWDAYGYEYSYPQEKYGYSPVVSEVERAKVDYEAEYDFDSRYEGEPGELIDYSQWNEPYAYEYAEPGDCYGEYHAPVKPLVESGLESFARHPSELLGISDQEVLRTLELLCEEPSGARRSVLNDHLEGLGFVAIDFAARFEDMTGMESLSLADDLPGVAALLGCFRLVEQGELGMDEAVAVLRRTLEGPSEAWIEGVREIAARSYEGRRGPVNAEPQASAGTEVLPGSVAKALTSALEVAWKQVQGACLGAVDRLVVVDWEAWFSGFQSRLAETRAASAYDAF